MGDVGFQTREKNAKEGKKNWAVDCVHDIIGDTKQQQSNNNGMI